MVLNNLLHLVSLLLTCSWKYRKRVVGNFIPIIRPSHLLKKLLAAAVEQSNLSALLVFNRAAAALQQRDVYPLDVCPFSSVPSSYQPTAWQCRLCVAPSQLWANISCRITTDHYSRAKWQLSVSPLCWPSVHKVGRLCRSSELPASHQWPVWKHACCVCVILQ